MSTLVRTTKHEFYLLLINALAIVACVFIAVFFDINYLIALAVPIIFGFVYFAITDFRKIFFILLILLPFTKEFHLPGFSMDIPGEPILISLLLIAFFYFAIHRNIDFKFIRNPLIAILICHIIWIFIAALFSDERIVSIKFFLSKLWHVIPFIFFTKLFVKDLKDFKKLFWFLIIPTTLAIIIIMGKHALVSFSFADVNYASSIFFRNHVNYAAYVSLLFPYLWLSHTWYKKGTRNYRLILFFKIIFLIAIYLAFARGAWLALIAAVIFYYALKGKKVIHLLIPMILLIFFIGNHLAHNKAFMDYAPQFEKAITHENIIDHLKATIRNQEISTAERYYRWVAGVRMSTEKPATGFGPGNFVNHYKNYTVRAFRTYVSDNPEKSGVHNYFLMTLVEQGFPGFFLFLFLTIAIFYLGVKAYYKASERKVQLYIAAILCSFVVIYVQLMLSDLIETIKIGGFYFINLALLATEVTRQLRSGESTTE